MATASAGEWPMLLSCLLPSLGCTGHPIWIVGPVERPVTNGHLPGLTCDPRYASASKAGGVIGDCGSFHLPSASPRRFFVCINILSE